MSLLKKEQIIIELTNQGLCITSEALDYIIKVGINKEDLEKLGTIVKKLKPEIFIISEDTVKDFIKIEKTKGENSNNLVLKVSEKETQEQISPTESSPLLSAREILPDIEIISDPAGEKTMGVREIDDFLHYFRDRFEKLSNLLKMRRDVEGYIPIKAVKSLNSKDEIKIIGMVKEKRSTKTGNVGFELEDLEASIQAFTTDKIPESKKKAERLVPDQVVCATGRWMTNRFMVTDITWPDLPFTDQKNRAKEEVCAAFISDIHYGSGKFDEETFKGFIRFLQGKNGAKYLAEHIKYVLIVGDMVDGVGIYPGQEKDLKIPDIFEQYDGIARLLSEIPDHIQIIAIPGNHDATRQAEPQPAIDEKFAKPLYDLPNVSLYGNPLQLKLHGVNILLYHGRSILDDIIGFVPGLSIDKPAETMKELLKCRHLAPYFGGNTPTAAGKEDMLVIQSVPDIFLTGHAHVNDFSKYRGVFLINTGTFQKQTDYQKSQGINPTPGKVPIINLKTFKITLIEF